MKKIVYLFLGLLIAPAVFAGSIDNLDYKDRVMFWDINRQIDDNDVNIDADTLGGTSILTINEGISTAINQKHKGESGLGKNDLGYMLTGDGYFFYNFDTYDQYIFIVIDEKIDKLNLRYDKLEAMILYPGLHGLDLELKTGLITARRTGEKVKVDGYICSWFTTYGDCSKVS